MDIRMPILNGLEATRQLREENDPPHVIVLTTFDADNYVLEAIAAGADGFILKDTPPAEIVAAIRKVAAGEPMLSPSVTAPLIRPFLSESPDRRATHAPVRLDRLTQRDREESARTAV